VSKYIFSFDEVPLAIVNQSSKIPCNTYDYIIRLVEVIFHSMIVLLNNIMLHCTLAPTLIRANRYTFW